MWGGEPIDAVAASVFLPPVVVVGVRRSVGEVSVVLWILLVLDRPLLLSGRRGDQQTEAVDFGQLDDI